MDPECKGLIAGLVGAVGLLWRELRQSHKARLDGIDEALRLERERVQQLESERNANTDPH